MNKNRFSFLFYQARGLSILPHYLAFLLIMFALVSCSPDTASPDEVEVGFSRDDVIEAMGQPAATQEFILPDEPFFGPQEGLANLLPPGTVVEEWVYELDGEILYVWFASDLAEPRERWLVVATATYPEGVVF